MAAAKTPGVWGIDLGQCALKALRLEMKDGEVVATAFEYIEYPKILSQPDADPDELTNEALTQFLERNNIKGDQVAISVPGQSGLARFVKLPPVDEKKIADIVKFEAKQQIPFPLEEVVWDFQRLNKGDIIDGLALETEIGLFAMKRDMVNRAIQQFKKVNIEVHYVQMAPLALCNFVAYDLLEKGSAPVETEEGEESLECIVCLEIGTDNSNLVITNGGRIIWQRPIPIGGNHFTRALTKEMKLTFAKAEHLKRNAAKSPDLKKILSSLKQVLNDFVGELQRSLGYFTNTHRNAQIQYMIGLGNAFRLPGLQKFLQEKLQLEVRKFTKMERATGESVTTAPTFAENIMSFGVAYGLALQALGEARLRTNLLPPEVRLERVIRAKKPWALTAAASLLFGLFLLAAARGMEQSAVENNENKEAVSKLEKAQKTAKGLNSEFQKVDTDLKDKLTSLNKIGAGIHERLNWQLLLQYINLASPQPNGDRLVARSYRSFMVKDEYWTKNKDAQKAFALYEERRFDPKAMDKANKAQETDRAIKEHLVQVNIVGVNALYTEDMTAYFKRLHAADIHLRAMEDDQSNAVKALVASGTGAESDTSKGGSKVTIPKEGWVVEIRGYTYHKAGDRFIENTLIENLKYPQLPAAKSDLEKALAKEMQERVQKKISFLTLHSYTEVKNPVPGQFQTINKSVLKSLVKSAEAAVDPTKQQGGMPPVEKAPQNDPNATGGGKPSRDSWKPIGEIASSVLVDGGVGGGPGLGFPGKEAPPPPPIVMPGSKEGEPKGVQPKTASVPRYEFVVLFVWQEPLLTQDNVLGDPQKK